MISRKNNRRSNNILPLSYVEMYPRKIKYINFNLIFAVAMFVGLPVPVSILGSKRKLLYYLSMIWCMILTFCRTISTIICCLYLNRLLFAMAARATFYGYCISGYMNLLIFIKNREKIAKVIYRFYNLSGILNFQKRVGIPYIKSYLFIFLLAACSVTIIQINYFFYQEWDTFFEKSRVSTEQEFLIKYEYIWLIVFSCIFSYHFSSLTCYVMLLLCCGAYYNSCLFFHTYMKKLKRDLMNDLDIPSKISQNLHIFRRIIMNVKEMDNSLNACTFFIYTSSFSTFLNTVSVVLTDTQSYRTVAVNAFVGITFVWAFITYFILTYSGSAVGEMCTALKNELTQLSASITKRTRDVPTILMLNLFCENIHSTECHVTGMGFFYISRGFVLSTIGMLATYGVVIYQVGVTPE